MNASMENAESNIAPLAGANMPADRGLTGLGLLMQLSGAVFLAYGALLTMLPMLAPAGGDGRMQLLMVAILSVVRSAFHRSAGRALLYGHPKGPLHQVRIYIGVALAQSVAVFLLLGDAMPTKTGLYLLTVLAAWPIALAVVLAAPRFRNLGADLDRAEDMGFESAAVLMTIFGILGAMTSGLVIVTIYQSPFFRLSDVPSFLWLGVIGMLFVRSIFHAKAGLAGCTGVGAEHASHSAARYFNFGMTSAIIASAVLMLQMIMEMGTLHLSIFASVGVLGYLLLVWPLILRNFFTDRNFSILLDEQEITRRAPDTGLTALGWLLLATGSLSLATSLGAVLFIDSKFMGLEMLKLSSLSAPGIHSPWWSIGLAALQLTAAFELIRMSPRYKLITTIYGGVSVAVTLYLWWPLLKLLSEPQFGGPMVSIQIYGALLMSLAMAISAVLLVNRNTSPDAKARINES
ncbi:MAG: hypothetical protein GY811_25040 [Myxococcales bacterium]|nr:hypothetical protein [Myxococcales bacterium]